MNRKTLTDRCYKLAREIVLHMAHHSCQLCGGDASEVHHVIRCGMGGNVRARIAVMNMLAICRICHGKLHDMGRSEEYSMIEENFPAVYAYVLDYKPAKSTVPLSWLRDQKETLTNILKSVEKEG